jgi:hypothetical protein
MPVRAIFWGVLNSKSPFWYSPTGIPEKGIEGVSIAGTFFVGNRLTIPLAASLTWVRGAVW